MTKLRSNGRDTLSAMIRDETLDAHEAAENTRFVQDLVAGRLPVEDYARLAAQHHAIYTALEDAVAANTDPLVARFLDPALARRSAIERDLRFLVGADWADRLARVPATERYVHHIDVVCSSSPVALLAHHYIRYLGDLSGGQVIGRVLQRVYGFEDHRGTEFYRFAAIESPKAFKDHYRDLLDQLPWDATTRRALIDEVTLAFGLNTAVFEDLARIPVGD